MGKLSAIHLSHDYYINYTKKLKNLNIKKMNNQILTMELKLVGSFEKANFNVWETVFKKYLALLVTGRNSNSNYFEVSFYPSQNV